ncbi:MAG TPA: carbamoyltransferase C-terminal domain-containing protein [Candidatus Dormibacteraeota bacterium]|nr:carbamoyltransferase C-terminal domain-containing protein [Candidatus Dormibacteraeota bacterium]
MRIMGIHDNHNASVCLLEDGKLVFALQEERLNRIKNYAGFPYLSINFTLEFNKLQMDDIDFFAFPVQHNPGVRGTQSEWIKWYKSHESFETPLLEAFRQSPGFVLYKAYSRSRRMKNIKKAGIPASNVRFVNHHLQHAAAAYYGSPYDKKVDDVLVLTLDGGGDGLCATVYVGRNQRLEKVAGTEEGHSIANIYASTTFLLGMTPNEHEYKVMGLAPYSKPEYFTSSYNKLNELIQVNGLTFRRTRGPPTVYSYPMLKDLLRYERFDNIAGALQRVTEEKIVAWVKNAIAKTGIRKLAVAGGAFMNVKANQKIAEMEECDRLFIFPSCGDESGSIGAAFETYAENRLENGEEPNIQPIGPIYLGPTYDESQIDKTIRDFSGKYSIRAEKAGDMDATIAELIEKNKVVARFDGRLEFGARALGNRSILANASDLSNVKKINNMIKMRDFWMPFAPTVLAECETDFLQNPKKIPAPYMVLSFNSTDRWRDIQAAIHSADLTARPQVLSKEYNADYWSIIDRFSSSTGVGAILNTSFNLHGEPIVGSPEDALSTFVRSGLEYLALGDRLVEKT